MGGIGFHFSSKYINAEIFDPQGRMHIVHIKNSIDNFFFATINKERYVFRIDESRIKIWYSKKLVKSFRILLYTTAHYLPISPEHVKELEMIITKNGLPKIDMMLYNILHELGRTEGTDFKPHNLSKLRKGYEERKDAQAQTVRNIVTYLKDLNVNEIITPVKNMTDFMWNDMIATDAKFLDTVVEGKVQAEILHREVSNNPIGAKKTYIMYILIGLAVSVIIGMVVMGWQAGWFNGVNLAPTFTPGIGAPGDIMSRYPTPEQLQAAIDRGEVNRDQLPPDVKKFLGTYKPPTVTPKQQTLEIKP